MDPSNKSGNFSKEKEVKTSKSSLVVSLVVLVILLSSAVAYFLLRENDIILFCKKSAECNIVEQAEEPVGYFHVEFGYPSDYLPGHRVCFNKVEDISDVYCFVSEGLSYQTGELVKSESRDYTHELVDGSGTLPVGQYNMTYGQWNELNSFIWNPCVRALNGSADYDKSVCDAFYKELNKAYEEKDLYNFSYSSVNFLGGDPIVIEIEEGKTTEIGSVALSPYF